MEKQNIEKIATLDYYALQTARDINTWQYPCVAIKKTSRNIFLGSGDADNTGRILAQNFGGSGFSVVDYKCFLKITLKRTKIFTLLALPEPKMALKWHNGSQKMVITLN